MNNYEQIVLCNLNLAEYHREVTRWSAAGEIHEQNDLLLTLSGADYPTTNVAMRLSHSPKDSAEIFKRIQSFYAKRQLSFSIHLRKDMDKNLETLCQREQMIPINDTPGMIATAPLASYEVPAHLDLRTINTADGVKDFTEVASQSFTSLGMPLKISQYIFSMPERLLQPYNHIVVAYLEQKPVSAAMLIFSHGIAGIYWVATLESARRKGLADICVRSVTNEAFRRGAAFVTLQATQFGAPLYRRLGFKEVTRYFWYMSVVNKKVKS